MDFGAMLNNIKLRLANEIKGRETTDERIMPTARTANTVALRFARVPVNTSEGMFDFAFKVHADSRCNAIQSFLDTVNLQNITFAPGPKGVKVLGINNEAIPKLLIFLT